MSTHKDIMDSLPAPPARPAGASKPLAGIKVLDFTHFVAGPFSTMILADLGADVIKVENPLRGDEFRFYPPAEDRLNGEGPPFLWVNRNKRSLALDLKSAEGRKTVRQLMIEADVLVENFSTGTMEKFGLGYAECAAANPRLVYCSSSAFGREGEFAHRNGFDTIMQAEAGFIAMNGYPDREGVRTGSSSVDIACGMMAANVIQAALLERYRSGQGQRVEASLFDTAVTMVGYINTQFLFSGTPPGRYGNTSPDSAPTGVFYASDGALYINCSNTPMFERLFRDVLGRNDLATDEELLTRPGRLKRRDELFEAVNKVLATNTRDYWISVLMAADVPAGAVRTVPDALTTPEMKSRQLITKIAHPTAGEVPNVGLPIRLARTPIVTPVAAPTRGQHNDEILTRLAMTGKGFSEAA